jgi:hypothetical protein
MSHSDRHFYDSSVEIRSSSLPGVRFTIERMSFGRRLELIRRLKDWLGRLEFAAAGPEGARREAEAALLAGEIDRIWMAWGLRGVAGLQIDGEEATPEVLLEKGPEALVHEILQAIRREAGLGEAERKNCGSPSISSGETRPGGSATVAAV